VGFYGLAERDLANSQSLSTTDLNTSRDMTTRTPWLAHGKPNPRAAVRLFCFPYAGGGDTIFRDWPCGLPESIEVCPVQLPGRGARIAERPFTQLAPLVEAASLALAPHLDKPFAILGHSMGALIGFEVAHRLRRDYNLQPVHLFVSGRCSPQTRIERDTSELSDAEFIHLLSSYKGTPKEVLEDPELMELMLPVIRADFALSKSYMYRAAPPLDCPITAYGGLLDRGVKRDCMEGWREHTTSSFLVRMLPGDHFFVITKQHLLLGAIARELHEYVKESV
jgi:medium-chain acyl-[acyl-carrier-protein] hydrolase